MKKYSCTALPEGYREYAHINLQNDKKTALTVNISGAALMIGLFVLAHFAFRPITEFFDIDSVGFALYFIRLGVLLVGYIAYIVLHELTHAAVMRLFGASKIRFGFTGLYAFAGSEVDYFKKTPYILVALAPLTLWGVIFTVMLILVPGEWFWPVFFWQVGNIAGAVGDIYVTIKMLKMPSDILVMDTGTEMFVYSKAK